MFAIFPPPWSIIGANPIQEFRKQGKPRAFEPLTSAFGGLRAMFKAFVEGRYSGRLKKVDEK
jgi:hypothetical protein